MELTLATEPEATPHEHPLTTCPTWERETYCVVCATCFGYAGVFKL